MSRKYFAGISLVVIVAATIIWYAMQPPPVQMNTYAGRILNHFELVRKKQENKGIYGSYGDPVETSYAVQLYHWLDLEPPNKEQIVTFLNSKQGLPQDRNGWGNITELEKSGWSVVRFAFVLAAYSYLGERPTDTASLDQYFDALDEMGWNSIMNVIYQSLRDPENVGWWNPWGIAFAYPVSYYLWKGRDPPWLSDFFQFAKENSDTWIKNGQIHQMDHLMFVYVFFKEPVPYLNQTIASFREQQSTDGGWVNLKETATVIHALKGLSYYYNLPEISEMIQKSIPYVESCYSEVREGEQVYGVFKRTPHDQGINLDDEKLIEYTWYGAMLLIDAGIITGNTWALTK